MRSHPPFTASLKPWLVQNTKTPITTTSFLKTHYITIIIMNINNLKRTDLYHVTAAVHFGIDRVAIETHITVVMA